VPHATIIMHHNTSSLYKGWLQTMRSSTSNPTIFHAAKVHHTTYLCCLSISKATVVDLTQPVYSFSIIESRVLDLILQWSHCPCGHPLSYSLYEQINTSILFSITCNNGHVFANNVFFIRYENKQESKNNNIYSHPSLI